MVASLPYIKKFRESVLILYISLLALDVDFKHGQYMKSHVRDII